MATSVLRCLKSDNAALPAVVNHPCNFLKVRMTWPNTVVAKVFYLDDTVANTKARRLSS
jgi:hypothetical protein